MKAALVISFTAAFIAVLASFTFLSARHVDTTPLVAFVGGLAASIIPQLMTLLKVHQTQQDIAEVKVQTNGPLTHMSQQVQEIHDVQLKNGENHEGSS